MGTFDDIADIEAQADKILSEAQARKIDAITAAKVQASEIIADKNADLEELAQNSLKKSTDIAKKKTTKIQDDGSAVRKELSDRATANMDAAIELATIRFGDLVNDKT